MKVEVDVLGSLSLCTKSKHSTKLCTELRSCVKVEVDVLGSPSLILRTVSVDVEQTLNETIHRAQELYESRGGRPGLPVPNSPYGLCGRRATLNGCPEFQSCVKVEADVLGSPFLILRTVSVDVEQH